MTTPYHCFARGMLVSCRHWIPRDAIEYGATESILPAVGCNRLHCHDCGAALRVLPGWCPSAHAQVPAEQVYLAADPAAVAGLERDSLANLYACRCCLHAERNTQSLESIDDRRMLDLPWACAGHPRAQWPAQLDGDRIDLDVDLHGTARMLLLARLPRNPHPAIATLPGFQAVRVYRLLESSSVRAALTASVCGNLTDPDPRLRKAALGYCRLLPRASGVERVLTLRHKRLLWAAVDPDESQRTLRHTLRLALDAIERANREGRRDRS